MVSVPAYIEPYADCIKVDKNTVSFSLKCDCGCDRFHISKNAYYDEEKRRIEECGHKSYKGWHTVYGGIDKNGKPYWYIKVLGIFKKYLSFEPEPVFAKISVVKAKCISCEKEITIFDNRVHGYDAMFTTREALEYSPHFDKVPKDKGSRIIIIIEQDEQSHVDSVYFSNITVYVERDGKKKVFFDMETA